MFIQQKANSMRTETVLLASVSKNLEEFLAESKHLRNMCQIEGKQERMEEGRELKESTSSFIHKRVSTYLKSLNKTEPISITLHAANTQQT